MCFLLYLASSKVRPAIAWDEKQPGFLVKIDDPEVEKVRSHFSRPHIHYLGSSDGCGCAFRRDPDWVFAGEEEARKQLIQESQLRLYRYLSECLQDEEAVELYGCWAGDEGLPIENDRVIGVEELIDPGFYFRERERLVVGRSRTERE